MPRLPRNLVKRGGAYYFREQVNGRVRRISLGKDRDIAIARLRSLKNGTTQQPVSEITVEEAATRWLSSYVSTAREPRGQTLAAQRVRDFLVPCLGHLLLVNLK